MHPFTCFLLHISNQLCSNKSSMSGSRRISCLVVMLLSALAMGSVCSSVRAQANEWTWMGGSSTLLAPGGIGYCAAGNYGNLGVPSPANYPSPRQAAVAWTDKKGNRWLFGGYGCFYWLFNDLWKYDSSKNEWVWISGSDTPNQNGIYGTSGSPASGNVPSARWFSSAWTDTNGNLWLFGGQGGSGNHVFGSLNDLWEFNPSTSEWTWMAGSDVIPSDCPAGFGACGQSGVYGTLGTAAAGNSPGGRVLASTWKDKSGNLWLFGGWGYDSAGHIGYLNDLWAFNIASGLWKWMGGSDTLTTGLSASGVLGVYGTLGKPAAGNVPGGRYETTSWVDASGNFWLFGGSGVDSAGYAGTLNDLWMYDVSLDQWAWMNGSATVPPGCTGNGCNLGWPAVYGTLGDFDSSNQPGGRYDAMGWTDHSGNIWLFGGAGADPGVPYPYRNDLWQFDLSMNQWAWIGGAKVEQAGVYGTLRSSSPANVPGARVSSVVWTDSSDKVWLFGGFGFDSQGNTGVLNDLWTYQLPLPRTFTFAALPTSVTIGSGLKGTTTLTVTPQNGFKSAVSFACSGLPSNATCSFSPTTLTPSGAAATTQLTITVSTQANVVRQASRPVLPATGLAIGCCFLIWKRRRVSGGPLLVVSFAGAMLFAGCGGGGVTGGGGSSQTYTVTVTATSGTLQQTASLTLTEN